MQRERQITEILNQNFALQHLEVMNESHMHSVPPNSETHFKVVLVSDDFEGQSKVKRHQAVYALLSSMMQEGLHALALHTHTVGEWQSAGNTVPDSPDCMGGSKKSD
ncbi:MAG: BolA family transcriptional regulator [Oleiphilus sp.]|nr:MAG: BolA family transcriptional regulator [Oleiphilus sp.]